MKYSNPRMKAVIPDWPSGRHIVEATFAIEIHPTRGERATRVTTGAVKKLTYAYKARIVDGDDGRTYIIELTRPGGHISIMQGTMKFQQACVFADFPQYPELLALFG